MKQVSPTCSPLPLIHASKSSASGIPELDAVHRAIIACDRCVRLRSYCAEVARVKKRAHQGDTYWGKPVPGFGDPAARLLLVGLAPAAHGANRTGRIFTGDGRGGSGDFLMSALHRSGFANRATSDHVDDGLQLYDAFITMAVRCAPPDNKPLPEENARCLDHLAAEVAHLRRVRVVLGLGKIGFDAWLQFLRREKGVAPRPRPTFGHGAVVRLGEGLPVLLGCYHPSRQNTHTGKLTARMMEDVLRTARRLIRQSPA